MPPTSATFGELLRQYRLAAGLTQEGLAERAGLSEHGIQKLERGATHPSRETAQRLELALKLEPDEQARFRAAVRPVRRHEPPPTLAAGGARQDNLPIPTTRFVARAGGRCYRSGGGRVATGMRGRQNPGDQSRAAWGQRRSDLAGWVTVDARAT